MRCAVVFLVALAVTMALAEELLTFPELARGNARIVSGWEATEGQLPHQLSIRMVNSVGQVFACGASIIHNEWALTAAHCTAGRHNFVVRAGTVNLTRPYYIFETSEFYNHPLYNNNLAGVVQPNDVGVLKFSRWLEFNELIQPIRIQRSVDKDNNYDGYRMTASGWGNTWTSGSSPENLNWVFLRGVTNFFCWLSFGGSSIVQSSTICASGYNDTTQSTCQGDSGGPLTVIDQDGKPTLVGVTSFVSSQGCHADLPAGFCRGGYYHSWYKEITGIDFDWDFEQELTTPEETPTTEVPEESPATEVPEETSTTEVPEESPATEVPEETSTTEVPEESPATEVPEETSTTEVPEESPATEVPEETSTTEVPEESPATEVPEETSTTEVPEESPATEVPEETSTTEVPEESPATEVPEETSTTEVP